MSQRHEQKMAKRLVSGFVEEVGAAAVVVVYSKTDGQTTSVQMARFGNVLTCIGLVDWLQDRFEETFGDPGRSEDTDQDADEDVV